MQLRSCHGLLSIGIVGFMLLALAPGVLCTGIARLLAAKSPTVVHQCSWDPGSSSCDADDAVNIMYAIHSRPASAYLWFLLMTYDRESACGVHTTASACNGDKANRCIYYDDILRVIEGRSNPGSSSSSSSSKQTESSSVTSSLALDLAAAFLVGSTSDQSGSAAADRIQQLAVMDQQRLKQQFREHLQQQQQDLQEALRQQMGQDQQQQSLLQESLPAVGSSDSSSSSSSSSASVEGTAAGTVEYSTLAPTPNWAHPPATSSGSKTVAQPSNSQPAAAAAKRRVTARAQASQDVLCTSTDLLENYIFTQSAYSNLLQAPLAMHCPGSKASDLVRCMRFTEPADCKAHGECVFVRGSVVDQRSDMCVSRYFHSLTPRQVKQFTYDVAVAEPSVVGGCDGACWMRQAMLCNRTRSAAACKALSFCRSASKGTCIPRLYTADNFGSSVQEYMGECVEVDNKRDCESLRLRLVNKGTYGRWQMSKAPTSNCPVPSIRRLLGSSDVVQERGSWLITAAGTMEERAAEQQAAGAAAAAAANAAQQVLGSGPVVLRQIYFKESRP